MKHIPKYLLPKIASVQGEASASTEDKGDLGFVPFKRGGARGSGRGRGRGGRGGGGRGGRGGKKKSDPLKKFGK